MPSCASRSRTLQTPSRNRERRRRRRKKTDGLYITGPGRALAVGEYAMLEITGMPAERMPAARVKHYPRGNVAVVPAQTWGGTPFIWFGAQARGTYLVSVSYAAAVDSQPYAELEIEVGDPEPTPPPTPVNPYTPADEWIPTVKPLVMIELSPTDADALAGMYASVAGELAGGADVQKTMDLRRVLVERGKPLDIQGRYAGLAATMEQVFTAALTLENRTLDKAEAVKVLHSVAWAVWEAGHNE